MTINSEYVTFENVFIAAISDVESFYEKKYSFKVRYKLHEDDYSYQHASIYGAREKSFIRFSSDCCNKRVENIKDFFVALIIVCHELAHYLNHHNYYASPESEDSRLIEAWADRFGMSIFMTLITYGTTTRNLAEAVGLPAHSGERLDEIGKAFEYMARYLYNNDSEKYHSRLARIMHVAAGVNSFLECYWGDNILTRAYDVYTRIYTSANLIDLVKKDFEKDNSSKDNFDKVRTIHLRLQGDRDAITLGLKEQYRLFIDTSFVKSKDVAKLYLILRYMSALQQSVTAGLSEQTINFFKERLQEACYKEKLLGLSIREARSMLS